MAIGVVPPSTREDEVRIIFKSFIQTMIFFYLIYTLISYLHDLFRSKPCWKISGQFIKILHHFFASYITIGTFFGHALHLFITLVTLISWRLYKQCILTKLYNHVCDSDEKFVDIFWLIRSNTDFGSSVQYIGVTLIIILDLYLLGR